MWKVVCFSLLVAGSGVARAQYQEPAPPPDENEAAPPSSKTDLIAPFADPETAAEPAGNAGPSSAKTAETTLYFRNDAGNAFALNEARFVMDGNVLPTVITNAQRGKSYVIYTGPVTPGRHIVTVQLGYQGRSRGAFSYMKAYKLNVSSDSVFTTPEGRPQSFTIVGKEQKGLNVPLDRRLAISVEENPAGQDGSVQRVSR